MLKLHCVDQIMRWDTDSSLLIWNRIFEQYVVSAQSPSLAVGTCGLDRLVYLFTIGSNYWISSRARNRFVSSKYLASPVLTELKSLLCWRRSIENIDWRGDGRVAGTGAKESDVNGERKVEEWIMSTGARIGWKIEKSTNGSGLYGANKENSVLDWRKGCRQVKKKDATKQRT